MAFATRWPGEKESLLVYEVFEAHVTESVKAAIAR